VRVCYFTIRFILYIMTFGDTSLSRLVSSVLADARCVLAYVILSFDSFQKEWSRSHEEPREPFYSPVVNHFINLRRIMPQVKRRSEVNVSSAPSISRSIPSYLFSPTSSSILHKHYQDEEKRCYLESKNQSEVNRFIFFNLHEPLRSQTGQIQEIRSRESW